MFRSSFQYRSIILHLLSYQLVDTHQLLSVGSTVPREKKPSIYIKEMIFVCCHSTKCWPVCHFLSFDLVVCFSMCRFGGFIIKCINLLFYALDLYYTQWLSHSYTIFLKSPRYVLIHFVSLSNI